MKLKLPFFQLLRRTVFGIPLLGVGMTALLLTLLLTQGGLTAGIDHPKQATVIIQFDEMTRLVRPVSFTNSISGLKALELSGVAIVTRSYNFGDAVCSIGGVGCPAENCFCSTSFWSYWYWDGDDWQSYPVGASSSVISQTGAIEGWRWGEFGSTLLPITPTIQAQEALVWLAPRQTITGDFGGVGATVETLLALGANEQSNELANHYLALNGAAYSRNGAAAAGKLATALAAGDACLPAGALTPAAHFSPTLGAYSAQSGVNAWAILGAIAISEAVSSSAVDYLAAQIQPTGGWEWSPGWGVDTNSTALAIQALIAAGRSITSSAVLSGLAYLETVQNPDGGFPYAAGDNPTSDVNSTAYVVQALIAAGENPRAPRWTNTGGNPFDYLATMQLSDGSFEWQQGTGSNQLATQQAIPALLGRPHPAQRRSLDACPGIYLPSVHYN